MNRLAKFSLAFVFVALVAACSLTTVAYNNAPTAVAYVVDDWVDLTPEQREWLKPRVNKLVAWHRSNELPQYRSVLNRASERLNSDAALTPEEINQFIVDARGAAMRLTEQAMPDMVAFLQKMSPEQITFLEKKYASENERMGKELKLTPQARREARVKRYFERYEAWMCSLTPAQRETIRTAVEPLPFNDELRLEDRARWQREFIALLRTGPDEATLTRELRILMLTPDVRRSAEYQSRWTGLQKTMTSLTVELMISATPEQRRTIQRKLNGYASDVTSLLKA
jgi:hypothetical protein